MDKYEISLWEDYPDLTSDNIPFLNERKICVIGSDIMKSAARALEPKLVSNVNGTNTFSFRIYYRYKDEITGEENINPYLSYIINERKVKVLWKDKWYDLVIKKIEEDTQKRSVLCTCEDLFISELSKNGYELEFNSELQNNSGTASELITKVLDGSGWQPAAEQQRIIQYQEEPVYEVYTRNSFTAIKQSPSGDISVIIPANKLCLLYQSCLNENCVNIQFLYNENGYATEDNNMLVLNGDCYTFTGTISYSGDQASIINSQNKTIFQFIVSDSFSSRFRAKRLVSAQLTVFDNLLGRYVDVYENNIYGYETTEYSDPTLVVNLIANSRDFKDTKGWIGYDLKWEVYPSFTGQNGQTVVNYNAKSYLHVTEGYTYNTGLVSNKQYLTPNSADIKNGILGGFQVGEKYIFRYKAKLFLESSNYITNGIEGNIYEINTDYTKKGDSYFQRISSNINDGWVEDEMICVKTCTANALDLVGFFVYANSSCYIEDIQFFKLAYGISSYDSSTIKRMDPGQISLQSIAKVVYRYYNADHDGVTDAKDLKFLYSGEIKQNNYIPKYNNYEKITSIEESKSNRFNILQSIAEKFECWVRFIINHDETGRVLYDEQGLPQKYVQLVEQIGHDTGISFEYGIDLKGIKRTIVSNTIATKAIIIPNENEFGEHGFCTIARSQLNYCRENFILNFDYYIQQGLLNKGIIESDLYKTNGNNLGYYFYLNKFNRQYDSIADTINIKQIELTKQKAEYKVQSGNYRAALEKLDINKADLMSLANVDTFSDAQEYASIHPTNRKVQSLMGSIAQLKNDIQNFEYNVPKLKNSIDILESYINEQTDIMNQLVENIGNLHKAFFKKYSRFIQEGTWQDQNYVDDDKYYLDALEVAYRSSRPQIQYDISLLRLSGLEDFSSKVFDLGDICYIQDKEFFGYEEDNITPYKQKIIISQLTSYFDTPQKDVIKVQNYKTQFDDLFQRITTTTQALQFSQGRYERAAGAVKPDGTLSFGLLQDTFDYNKDLIINSANQEVTWDNTGITVSDSTNSALKVKIMAGGIFASDDGGDTWKNALRGDGISTDLLTAGRINTSEIFVYDGNHQSFRWDSEGINAYTSNLVVDKGTGEVIEYPFSKFVRFDRFGIYGYQGTEDFAPATETDIWDETSKVKFGLTWKGFFLRGTSDGSSLEISDDGNGITFLMSNVIGDNSLEISTSNDIILRNGDINRVQIGRLNPLNSNTEYGIWVRDENGANIFNVSSSGTNSIGGWTLNENSFYHTSNNNTIGLYSNGKSATVQGNTANYYILAGNNFGVTIDGQIYASAGKIGGWNIGTDSLFAVDRNNRSIVINSSGSISVANQTDDEGNITSGWEINSNGDAIFHQIEADNGTIAGWMFTPTGLYNTQSGTTISSDSYDNFTHFTIDTDSLRAQGGLIGGWTLSPTAISTNGVTLGSSGILNLGPNGQLQAGNIIISKDTISFGDKLTIGGFYQDWLNDRNKLINDVGITLDNEEGLINIGGINTRLITAENNASTAITNATTAQNTANDIKTYLQNHVGINFNTVDGTINIFADHDVLQTVNGDLSNAKTVLNNNLGINLDAPAGTINIFTTAQTADDAKGEAESATASIQLMAGVVNGHTTSIATIDADITNINSDIVNIKGRLIADSISSDRVSVSKNIYSSSGIYARAFYEDLGDNNGVSQMPNMSHRHTFDVANDGTVTILGATTGTAGTSFNIANTAFYQAGVLAAEQAVTIKSIAGTSYASTADHSASIVDSNKTYTNGDMVYGRFNITLSNSNTPYTFVAGINGSKLKGFASDIGIYTPDNSNNPNSSDSINKYFTIKANNDTSNYIRIYKSSNEIKWYSTKGTTEGTLFTIPQRTAFAYWCSSTGQTLDLSNNNDSVFFDSNDYSSKIYYRIRYSDGSYGAIGSFWVNTYKAWKNGYDSVETVVEPGDDSITYTIQTIDSRTVQERDEGIIEEIVEDEEPLGFTVPENKTYYSSAWNEVYTRIKFEHGNVSTTYDIFLKVPFSPQESGGEIIIEDIGVDLSDISVKKVGSSYYNSEEGTYYVDVRPYYGSHNGTISSINVYDAYRAGYLAAAGSSSGTASIESIESINYSSSTDYSTELTDIRTFSGYSYGCFRINLSDNTYKTVTIYWNSENAGSNEGDVNSAWNMGYAAGRQGTYGNNFERAWNQAYSLAVNEGYTNAYEMADAYQKGYKQGYMETH